MISKSDDVMAMFIFTVYQWAALMSESRLFFSLSYEAGP